MFLRKIISHNEKLQQHYKILAIITGSHPFAKQVSYYIIIENYQSLHILKKKKNLTIRWENRILCLVFILGKILLLSENVNWHGVGSEPAELEVSFLFNLGGKKYERLKMKLLHQNSHLIFIFSATQLHQCSTDCTPSCIIQGSYSRRNTCNTC